MPLPNNRAVIAAAGSRKTQLIIDEALAAPPDKRILITTYTRENCDQIIRRLHQANGCIPANVQVLSWFAFLINQAARPYQSAITGRIDYARSLNFKGSRNRFATKKKPLSYYFDSNADFYRDGIADFAVEADKATGGRVVGRLEALYDAIYIDELQDLAGHDLDFLDLLFASAVRITVVGDPRQATFATNQSNRLKKRRGEGLVGWLEERSGLCAIEPRTESWRCNQKICDWADDLYPHLPRTTSQNRASTGHDDVFYVAREDVEVYVEKFHPTMLRWNRNVDTQGFPAMNFGVSKGSTFDRVLIFPTKPIMTYLLSKDVVGLKAREHLYVAVTRARYSVAFVVDRQHADYTP